ncbi:hypothetical protein STEG23_038101, partial [Scotinomys teguina]
CSVSCGGGVRIRSVTCAKNHNEPCDKTRKPNSRALCGLQQCPSSRRVLKPNKDIAPSEKNQPTPEYDSFKPIPAPTSRPKPLSTPTVPELMSTSSAAISLGPTMAPEDGRGWQNSSTQTKEDSHYPTSSGSTSQVPFTSWAVGILPDDENVSSSAIGPTSEADLWATRTSDSGLTSSNAVTWQVTPFYNPLTTDPEMEMHSGSGEDSDQSMSKEENNSVIWNKSAVPEHESSMERNAEIPLGPPPTSSVGEETSWPPLSTKMEGLVPEWSLKKETPRVEGMITEKSRNIPLPLGGGHQSTPSEKLENHDHLALPNDTNPSQDSGPVLTEEDASSLIAEGFLLNASNYKPLMKDHSPAYWIAGNWSKCSTTCGLGAYWRSVECSTGMNADCAAIQRPDPAKKCHLRPCAGWRVGNWSECSRNCSGGFKIREIQCMDSQDHHRSLRPFHCQFLAGIPPPLSMSCNLEPCGEWQVDPWSQCTTSCGDGSQKRTVHCIPSENSTTEDQNQCLCDHEVRPPEIQNCNQQACRKNAALLFRRCFLQILNAVRKLPWHEGALSLMETASNIEIFFHGKNQFHQLGPSCRFNVHEGQAFKQLLPDAKIHEEMLCALSESTVLPLMSSDTEHPHPKAKKTAVAPKSQHPLGSERSHHHQPPQSAAQERGPEGHFIHISLYTF